LKNFIKIFTFTTILFIGLLQLDFLKITNIYFFDGVYLLMVATLISFFIFRKKSLYIVTIIIAIFSMNFGFFVLFPVSYERSVSVSLLNSLSEDKFEKIVTKEDLRNEIKKITNNDNFLDKRIEEQLYTGYIEEVDGGYKLTSRIKNFVYLQNFISVLFNTR
jgi:uncharacterized protein YacL